MNEFSSMHSEKESLPLSQEGAIDRICDEFGRQMRANAGPLIEDYLVVLPESARRFGLKELLAVELEFRQAAGHPLDADEYFRRFPEYRAVVEAELHRVTGNPASFATPAPTIDPTRQDLVTASWSSAAENDDDLPQRLGRYEIRSVLGGGGFGRVYLAYDPQLERFVAIKVPNAKLFATGLSVETFLAEARHSARLKHPGLVTIHDVQQEAGRLYIVQELIDGTGLQEWRKLKGSGYENIVRLMIEVGEAVGFAHQHGLVHRDLKPGNILVDSAGHAHVADFGLAVHESGRWARHGEIAGTAAYMSPEQVRGETNRLDGRTDVWSLGVILYEMLVDSRPFTAGPGTELYDAIKSVDPLPPRQRNPRVPKELERICLKCLEKRRGDRYTAAADLVDDLRHWLEHKDDTVRPVTAVAPDRSRQAPVVAHSKVMPKGLRSFDEHDADFFLDLLPGPRDREGLPERIRFWKTRIDETDPDKTFCVGLLYGPSGCGKSSLMKAGLFPRLAPHVARVYVEATPDDTEVRLLKGLRKQVPELPAQGTLAESLKWLRQNGHPRDRKVLIVLDQFEQWLHAHTASESSQLADALRHCDGGRVQCVLMVRDDFWMAVSRFMHQLEIPILEEHNSAAVDLFDMRHSRQVLVLFGRALGCLPEEGRLPAENQQFVDQAAAGLAENGKVVQVRLALYAEMVKGKPWIPATLKEIGGVAGTGTTFLEETFSAAAARPRHRIHQRAARAVLKALLPEAGADIKGHRRSEAELLAASGYKRRGDEFTELVRILDNELRLMTPADLADFPEQGSSSEQGGAAFYQLTHDYLVPSLRDWLTRKQRETYRGRAGINLAEQSALWNAKPVRRLLPSWWSWLSALALTRHRDWTKAQRRMMLASTRRHVTSTTIVAALLVIAVIVTMHRHRQTQEAHVKQLVQSLLAVEFSKVPEILAEIRPHRELVDPLLHAVLDKPHTDDEQLRVEIALLPVDAGQLPSLVEKALKLDPDRLSILITELRVHAAAVCHDCWLVAMNPDRPSGARLRAGCMLAQLDPNAPQWATIANDMVTQLANEHTLLTSKWAGQLRPASRWLIAPLTQSFMSATSSERIKALTADLLAVYVDEPAMLAALIEAANHEQFAMLLPAILAQGDRLVPHLRETMTREPSTAWPDDPPANSWPAPSSEVAETLKRSRGLLSDRWALCQTLPLAEFESVAAELQTAGYRPNCLRPYESDSQSLIAVTWLRDGRKWDWAHDQTVEELRADNDRFHKRGRMPFDIASTQTDRSEPAQTARFTMLWVERPQNLVDAQMYVGVPDAEHAAHFKPLNAKLFVPLTNLKLFDGDQGLFSSVRWKFPGKFQYEDCWSETAEFIASRAQNGWYQSDIRVTVAPGGETRYSATWWDRGGWSSRILCDLPPEEHLARCQEFERDGCRPVAVSVAWQPEARSFVGASCWRKPVAGDEARSVLACRYANAAMALLQLGHGEEVWPLLRSSPDPTVRSWLIHGFAPSGVNNRTLWKRLEVEQDSSVKQALLLSLSQYATSANQPPPGASGLGIAEALYRTDADPGVHSAAGYLLQTLGRLDAAVRPQDESLAAGRQWSQTRQGQTLAHIRGPIEFSMGSSAHELQHDSEFELQHRVRIPRSFAIGATEVTVEQYLKFDPDFDYPRDYAPDAKCPITMVDYYDALRYCRWLSENEQVPEEEMCYPPVDKIGEGMTVPADCLKRTGYRLPTEAEWEFACRAGTTTSRYFGIADDLLPHYDWTANNSRYRAWPVATLLPNDLGLFDMLGNAKEFCQNTYRPFQRPAYGTARDDDLEVAALTSTDKRVWRGGAFLYQPSEARSSKRDWGLFDSRHECLGFRIARTLPP